MYPSGTRLCTKDGRVFGNAIIIGYGVIHDEDMVSYQIMTDFGNVLFKRADEIDQLWWVADDHPDEISLERWLDAREQLNWSRSSMAERRVVNSMDAGSVPVVTATHVCKWIDRDDVTYCECGQSYQN